MKNVSFKEPQAFKTVKAASAGDFAEAYKLNKGVDTRGAEGPIKL